MPYCIVITKEGFSDAVSAVPSTWVKENLLCWPKNRTKSEIECLRRNENSIPEANWRVQNCRVKLKEIISFAEALKLEELYSNFEDTEEEERYNRNRQQKRDHPTAQYVQLMDLNVDMENSNIIDNSLFKNVPDQERVVITEVPFTEIVETNYLNPSVVDAGVCGYSSSQQLSSSVNADLIKENNILHAEIDKLRKENEFIRDHQKEMDRKFSIIQVQLDKILEAVNVGATKSSEIVSDDVPDEKIIENITFPIKSIMDLETLENKLHNKEVEFCMVHKFSKICGSSGAMQVCKIGLQLMRHLITDETLYQCSWRGIKGCNKLPLKKLVKFREVFFKILHLADKTCTQIDTDSFLQNSAIKHSGQRIRRKLSENSEISKRMRITETVVSAEVADTQ